ncbi:MAG: hypothetical protein IPL32_20420 [Chloracidobacterium sp.]|nr:hypothetical protein [Chloracidobacterium sp.]
MSDNPYLAEFEFGEESDGGVASNSGPGYWNDLPYFTARVQRSYLETTITYNNDVTFGDTALVGNVMSGGLYKVELNFPSDSAVSELRLEFGGTATLTGSGEWMARSDYGTGEVLRVVDLTTNFGPSALAGASSVYQFVGSMEVGPDAEDAGTFLLRGRQSAPTRPTRRS